MCLFVRVLTRVVSLFSSDSLGLSSFPLDSSSSPPAGAFSPLQMLAEAYDQGISIRVRVSFRPLLLPSKLFALLCFASKPPSRLVG